MKRSIIVALQLCLCGIGSMSAWADEPATQAIKTPEEKPPAVIADAGYQLGPEDVLDISVWKEEGLKKEVLVRPDGGLSFPLIGEIQAVGKTTGQLQKEIAQRLEKYIPDPVVTHVGDHGWWLFFGCFYSLSSRLFRPRTHTPYATQA